MLKNKVELREDFSVLRDQIAKFPHIHTFVDEFSLDLTCWSDGVEIITKDVEITEAIEFVVAKQSENPNYTLNDYFNEISFENVTNSVSVVKGLLNEMIELTKVIK